MQGQLGAREWEILFMVLPGLGKPPEEVALKTFDVEAHEPAIKWPAQNPPNKSDPMADHDCYSIRESGLFNCPKLDQPGREVKLPPSLQPKIALKFPVFDARLEPKYGVKNYIRTIANFYEEAEKKFSDFLPKMLNTRDPVKAAIGSLGILSDTHVYDCRTNILSRLGRKEIYIRSLTPRHCETYVTKFDADEQNDALDVYSEGILLLMQRELLLGSNRQEIMKSVQPVAFSYHAMLRLWERGRCSGNSFHLVMAEAFKRLRGISALVEVSSLQIGASLPHYIAAPLLDGFLIVSRRNTNMLSGEMRWGGRRVRKGGRMLRDREDEYFIWEHYFDSEDRQFTSYDCWFAVTYMGANDLSGWERSLAAQNFSALLEGVDLDHIARAREWIVRPPEPSGSIYHLNWPDPQKVMELQREMLPRPDPPDERVHFIRFRAS